VSRNKYRGLLVALLLLLVAYPVLRGPVGSPVLFDVLLSAVFLAALGVVFPGPRVRLVALTLGVPTVLGVWAGYALPGFPRRPLEISFHLAAGLFLAFAVATILRGVFRETTVTADSVYGGFCGYVLTGLAFGHAFCLVETLAPGSFSASGALPDRLRDRAEQHFLLSYFSLTTITTAGFGDVTPASDTARALAMVEAVAGQFYIAVLVAELVGKRLAQALPPAAPDPAAARRPGPEITPPRGAEVSEPR
jgi:hypothetical protein